MMMKRALSPEEVVTARGVGGTKTDGGSQFIIIVVLSPDLIISAKAKKVYEPRSHRPLPDP